VGGQVEIRGGNDRHSDWEHLHCIALHASLPGPCCAALLPESIPHHSSLLVLSLFQPSFLYLLFFMVPALC
jgi:hypothetical protein